MAATQRIRTVVYLGPSERQTLERISAETGAPIAELIRRAITEWLKQKKRGGDKR